MLSPRWNRCRSQAPSAPWCPSPACWWTAWPDPARGETVAAAPAALSAAAAPLYRLQGRRSRPPRLLRCGAGRRPDRPSVGSRTDHPPVSRRTDHSPAGSRIDRPPLSLRTDHPPAGHRGGLNPCCARSDCRRVVRQLHHLDPLGPSDVLPPPRRSGIGLRVSDEGALVLAARSEER